MNRTTSTQPPPEGVEAQVTGYVTGVREALADLAPEDLDDLTAGMAADLAEMARERGGALTDHLGSPASYAAELRAAAGLPARTGGRSTWRRLPERFGRRWRRLRADQPVVDAVATVLVSLRPAWWLLRGLAVAYLLADVFGPNSLARLTSPAGTVLAFVCMAASVWVGLRWRSPRRRWWSTVLNGALALAALVCVVSIWSMVGLIDAGRGQGPVTTFAPNEIMTSNFYVYDAAGRRVDSARIFTADGQALVALEPFMPWIGANPGTDPAPVPELRRTDVYGSVVSGVFPRRAAGVDPWAKQGNEIYGWTPPQAYPPLAPLSPAELPKPAVSSSPTRTPTTAVRPPAKPTTPAAGASRSR